MARDNRRGRGSSYKLLFLLPSPGRPSERGGRVEGGERREAGWHMLPPNKDYSKHLFTNSTLCLVCARERSSACVVISERYSPQDSVLFTGIITVVERIASVQSDYNQHMVPGND